MAVSPSGREIVTANGGPWRTSLTILERMRDRWEVRQVLPSAPSDSLIVGAQPGAADWRSVSTGLAFSGDRNIYVSEGNTGRISLFDARDERRRAIDINQAGFHDSYTGGLAFDFDRNILYAIRCV